jgi:hypothetical protein
MLICLFSSDCVIGRDRLPTDYFATIADLCISIQKSIENDQAYGMAICNEDQPQSLVQKPSNLTQLQTIYSVD